jgi:hypothetical protein
VVSLACTALLINLQALLKAMEDVHSAALGDWTISASPGAQVTSCALPEGLSPESLLHRHNMPTQDAQRLYDIMHLFSSGFHSLVCRLTAQAWRAGDLQEAIWHGYLGLWEASLHVHYPAHIAAVCADRNHACQEAATLASSLASARVTNEKLQAMCDGTSALHNEACL